jgi:predicted DNA-binding transcriptional regulator AlpA
MPMQLSDLGGLPPTLNTEQAADLFGVGVDHLWKLAREGRAPVEPLRLGRALRWSTAACLRSVGIEFERDDAEPATGSASITTLRKAAGRGRSPR